MRYKKAEIRLLGDAAGVIQNLQKTQVLNPDTVDPQSPFTVDAAYDLDE